MKKADFIDNILPFVSKASRYLGNEINAVKKDLSKVDLKFALAFPDAYEIGMSHLGLHILYNILNSQKEVACERVFTPWPDMEAIMRDKNIRLSTLESHVPVKDFDVLGFSLEYELSYANILKMLSLAGIPLLSKKRDESYPLVIAGGPCTYNPEPIADFFDAIVIGEAEELIIDFCKIFITWKNSKAPKKELLDALSEIDGIYIPSFFDPVCNEDGTIKKIIPLKKGYELINKRVISDFNNVAFCTSPIVPYMQIIHDRAGIEIARGCTRGCRFCMAGMIYRPVREKNIAKIKQLSDEALSNTGYEDLSLASLSSGDFSGIQEILELLITAHKHNRVSISLPSMRVETLTRALMDEIKQIRKTGFTIAPEAGTQRLRDVINKGITEPEIISTATQIFSAGWTLIKLYFMIGLPTETADDLKGIIDLSRKIASTDRRKQLNVSVSTFVPKPHTPFQWEQQDTSRTILEKQHFLKDRLQRGKIRIKWHNHNLSILEGVFSRGDRSLHKVIIKAHEMGAGFEAWTEHFQPELWDKAFLECGIDKLFYLRKRSLDECLPWSHISCGINDDFLKNELIKSQKEQITRDCRTNGCSNCGVCRKAGSKGLTCSFGSYTAKDSATHYSTPSQTAPDNSSFCYRLRFTKTGSARFLSHLELSRCFARCMRRAKLPLKYSSGFHPHPRIIFNEALPVGLESREEFLDILLAQKLDKDEIPLKINCCLPEGIKVLSADEIPLKNKPVIDRINKYAICFPEKTTSDFAPQMEIERFIEAFKKQKKFILESIKKGKSFQTDLKQIVREISLTANKTLELELNPGEIKTPRITDIAGRILHLGDKEKKALKIIKYS